MNALATMGMRMLGGIIAFAFLMTGTASAQQIVPPDDVGDLADLPLVFNMDTDEIDWEGYTFFPFEGAGLDRIENPDKSGINQTDYVLQYGKYAGQPWAGFFYHLEEPIEIDEDSVFRLKVWSPRAGINAMLKLEMKPPFTDVTTGDMFTPITVANQWTELEWDLSNVDDEAIWERVVIIMDLQGAAGDGSPNFIWYLDDFRAESRIANSVDDQLARGFVLDQNYPNPFNPTTNISFTLRQGGHTSLEVFDLLGQKVATVVNETLSAGRHETSFTANDLPSGIYFYRLQAGAEVQTRTLTLLK